jgi:hypothetical protein
LQTLTINSSLLFLVSSIYSSVILAASQSFLVIPYLAMGQFNLALCGVLSKLTIFGKSICGNGFIYSATQSHHAILGSMTESVVGIGRGYYFGLSFNI